ncbi:MAG: fumarate hydratase [Christensenellales bacterium]|jgi:fumarate hydratase subunit alpha
MKIIHSDQIIQTVKELCISACMQLPEDVTQTIRQAAETEPFAPAQSILQQLRENAQTAEQRQIPICQDTGMAWVMVKLGQEVQLKGMLLQQAVDEGVRQGYTEGYLRKSVVKDPLNRVNTLDNTPALLHVELVKGDTMTITVAPKGFGSENMSRLAMLTPSAGAEGVKDFVVDAVRQAGGNPCPPIVVGVGIGGSFDRVALLAKKALMQPLNRPNPEPYYAAMEEELLQRINELGIGPQGFGGRTTALGVKILTYPTHIAGLPVAVNINCHVTRHRQAVL